MSRTNGSRPGGSPISTLVQEGFQGVPETPAEAAQRRADELAELATGMDNGARLEAVPDSPADLCRAELHDWWHARADGDLAMLLPKAVEYSAHDLRMTGHVLADMMGIAPIDDAFAAELACATYLMSKVTRILGAYKEGRLPSMDSVVDARVYATMMARIREMGGWPGWDSATTTRPTSAS